MATIKRYEELEVWQLARQLALKIFVLKEKGLFVKDFGFKDQIKRVADSVMDNIAEGFGRGGNREFINLLSIAIDSCSEVQSQLYRAQDWRYITRDKFEECYKLTETIISKSGKFISYLNSPQHTGEKFKKTTNDKLLTTNHKRITWQKLILVA